MRHIPLSEREEGAAERATLIKSLPRRPKVFPSFRPDGHGGCGRGREREGGLFFHVKTWYIEGAQGFLIYISIWN